MQSVFLTNLPYCLMVQAMQCQAYKLDHQTAPLTTTEPAEARSTGEAADLDACKCSRDQTAMHLKTRWHASCRYLLPTQGCSFSPPPPSSPPQLETNRQALCSQFLLLSFLLVPPPSHPPIASLTCSCTIAGNAAPAVLLALPPQQTPSPASG